jgi:hypothetical protein
MPIKVQCACGKAFAAKDELAGKTVKCPNCQQPLKIPAAGAPAAAPGKSATKPAAVKPQAPAKPAASPTKPAAKPAAAAAPAGDSLFDEIGLQQAAVGTKPCPGCTAPMPIEAVVCIKCGYNARIGRRMHTEKESGGDAHGGHGAVAADLLNRAAQVMDEDKAEERRKTTEGMPWWIYLIGIALLIGFACMMLLLPLNKAMFGAGIALFVIAQLLALYSGIRILIVVFSESIVQGLLYLFVPFYALYYVFTRWDQCGAYFIMNLVAILIACAGWGALAVSSQLGSPQNQQAAISAYGELAVVAWHSNADRITRG